jgi:putative ABC transport system substrate-binding protein
VNRRVFLSSFTGGLLAAPLAAEAQPARIAHVGYLIFGPVQSPETVARIEARFALWQALKELGWVAGQNMLIDRRYFELPDQLHAAAAELVRLRVDLIVAPGAQATQAAQNATPSIPIVAWAIADPVGLGVTKTLSRPSGNVTGQTSIPLELSGKRFELLRAILPKLSRVAVLANPDNPASPLHLREARTVANTLRVDLQVHEVRRPDDLESAFTAMARESVGALFIFPDSMFFFHRAHVASLAATHRIPSMFEFREYVEAGGLISYGANNVDMLRRAALMVDRILKGARPSELPFEQPTKFELVINLKTAKALGLTIPRSLLHRADQVIE